MNAVIVALVVIALLVAVLLGVRPIRRALLSAPSSISTARCCRRCRTPSAMRWKPARSGGKLSLIHI